MSTPLRVMIMASGTGGHVFPAYACAQAFLERGCKVSWLATQQGIENRILNKHEIPSFILPMQGVRGKGVQGWLGLPKNIFQSLKLCYRYMAALHPQVVLGFGGYVTVPGGIMATLLRIPLVIHEQNAVPGLSNRFLFPMARKVCESYPNTFGKSDPKIITTGNPLRRDIIQASYQKQPIQQLRNILVIGGSQGSRVLNQSVPRLLKQVEPFLPWGFSVWHQTGFKDLEETKALYQSQRFAFTPKIQPFIDDMSQAYNWADLVICRAGALTLAELAQWGLPALLVPFKQAMDDHQTKNAAVMVDNGAAKMVTEQDLLSPRTTALLQTLLTQPEQLVHMQHQGRLMANASMATEQVVQSCYQVLGRY